MSALGGECERARGERKIRGEGGGGHPGIVLSFLPVSVPRCCVARRLGAGTTLHAAAPPGKVVFARPHRDSCSWGAALRACSWSASRDGHVRGVASRRSRQSCSPSTAASLTSCRAAQTMSTAPSTGTEAQTAAFLSFEGESSGSTNSRRTLCKQGGRPRFGAPLIRSRPDTPGCCREPAGVRCSAASDSVSIVANGQPVGVCAMEHLVVRRLRLVRGGRGRMGRDGGPGMPAARGWAVMGRHDCHGARRVAGSRGGELAC